MRPLHSRPYTRRAAVAFLSTAMTALAGCAGRDGDARATTPTYPTVERSVGEHYDTRSGRTVTVRNPRLRTAVVVDQHTSPVQMASGRQFVVVDVDVEGDGDSASGVGHRFRALTDGTPVPGSSAPLRSTFHPPERGRSVGVPVPTAAVETAAVAWVRGLPKSVTWSLPAAVSESLATTAQFRVDEVSISAEADPQVTLTVRNTGGRDGTFYANVSGSRVQDGNAVVGVEVPAGDTVTHRERPGIHAPAGEETRVVVRWGVDRASRVIRRD